MYTAKYVVKIEKTSNGVKKKTIDLVAKFRFRDEVAPKDRLMLRNRILNPYPYHKLYEYLIRTEKLEKQYIWSSNDQTRYVYDGNRKVKIEEPCSLPILGFNLKATSNGEFPLEELIDLDALDHFVLTGEMKFNEQEENK